MGARYSIGLKLIARDICSVTCQKLVSNASFPTQKSWCLSSIVLTVFTRQSQFGEFVLEKLTLALANVAKTNGKHVCKVLATNRTSLYSRQLSCVKGRHNTCSSLLTTQTSWSLYLLQNGKRNKGLR